MQTRKATGPSLRRILVLFVLTLIATALVACNGESSSPDTSGNAEQAATEARGPQASAEPEPAPPAGAIFDRKTFVLCPVLEEHKSELASIVGFEADPDRQVATFQFECNIHGTDSGFVKVEIAPAIESSIAMRVTGYEDPVSAAPELGHDALYIDAGMQPHVVFSIRNLIIDVGAEDSLQPPSRATMVKLASRVRDLLLEANR